MTEGWDANGSPVGGTMTDQAPDYAKADRWRCFHCGFETNDKQKAAAHFGEEGSFAICVEWANLSPKDRLKDYQSTVYELDKERDEHLKTHERIVLLRAEIATKDAEIASLKVAVQKRQMTLDAATKPLHAEIEALRAEIAALRERVGVEEELHLATLQRVERAEAYAQDLEEFLSHEDLAEFKRRRAEEGE